MASFHPSHDQFATANLFLIWGNYDGKSELQLFLMKSGLLGDFSGQCETCNEGKVKSRER